MRSPTAAAATSVRSDGTAASARQAGSPGAGAAVVAGAGVGSGASGSSPVPGGQPQRRRHAAAIRHRLPAWRATLTAPAGTPEEAVPMSIAASEQAVVDAVTPRLFIGGEWREAGGGGSFAVEDPSTGEELCQVADGTPCRRHGRPGRGRGRPGRVGRPPAPGAGRDPAPGLCGPQRPGRRAGPADDPGDGQAAGREQGRDHSTRPSSSAGSPRRRSGSTAATPSPPTARAAC